MVQKTVKKKRRKSGKAYRAKAIARLKRKTRMRFRAARRSRR